MSVAAASAARRRLAYVALGGNQGDVLACFRAALLALQQAGHRLLAISPAYWNQALKPAGAAAATPAENYWNAVGAFAVAQRTPQPFLAELQALEVLHGRQVTQPWAPRPLDLDLLSFAQCVCQTAQLTLPHARLQQRNFVLLPWRSIAPNFVVPRTKLSVAQHAARHGNLHAGIFAVYKGWF